MTRTEGTLTQPGALRVEEVFNLPETTIVPHRGLFDWRLGQLLQYRDLIALFVWRDFVSVYKQTILGPLWHLVKPVLTTATFTVVFSQLARLSTDGAPPFLFYMAGNVLWTYFSTCLDNVSKTLVGHAALLGKVYFHRLVIPISLVLSNLIAFGIQMAILAVSMGIYYLMGATIHPTQWLFVSPLLVAILAGYCLGGGLLVCAATTRYRDLNLLITFGLQLLMYLTPVIYPLSEVPPNYRWAAQLNPLTPIFEGFRKGLLGAGTTSASQVAASLAVMVVLLTMGMAAFTRAERNFSDTV